MRTTTDSMPPLLSGRLSLMMFLQYAIWGAWLPLLYPFLLGHVGMDLDEVGAILAAGAVGAIFGPFIAGQIADRYFSTERFLAISHLAGAVLVWFLADVHDFKIFLVLSLLYGLIYAPTLSLTNSLSFHHLTDRDRQFGPIRLWGTIGWIAAGIGVGQWLLHLHTPTGVEEAAVKLAQDAGRADAFRMSSVLGVILGLYCFTLPHTPPAKNAVQKNATFEAIGEVKRQPLLTLFLLAVPISIIHQFYFVHTSEFLSVLQRQSDLAQSASAWINQVFGVGGAGLMTIGQMAEIAVLGLIPFFAKRLTRKTLLAIGIAAYGARMAIFAYAESMAAYGASTASFAPADPIWIIIPGIALHGLCFGCFIFVAFMIVDEETTPDVRASAQNLFGLVVFGIGIIVGSWFATSLAGRWASEPVLSADGEPVVNEVGEVVTQLNYTELFSIPMWIAVACFVALLIFYPGGRRKESGGTRDVAEPGGGAAGPDADR